MLVVAAVTALTIVEYATGADLGFDNLLFREVPGAHETSAAGRMALGAAIGLLLLAGAIGALCFAPRRSRVTAVLAAIAATLAGLSLLGRLYGSVELTGLGAGTQIAPGTAIGMAALAIGVLANPAVRGPADVLARRSSGGRVARGFTVASLLILPALGFLREAGVNAGLFGSGFGISMIIAVGSASLVGVGLALAGQLDRLELDLRRTSETLRAILDASPLAIVAVDSASRVMFWSQGAERLYGWTEAEVRGRTPPQIPDDRDDVLAEGWRRIRAGEPALRDEVQRRTKTGALIDVAVHAVPMRNGRGSVVGLLTVQEDIRERKRLELELIEAHKMESVGRLAGGVAHDFNNILTAIIGHADLALDGAPPRDVGESLSTIRDAAERAAGLTAQLLAFGRRQMLRAIVVDANDVVLRTEALLRPLIGELIELSYEIEPNVGSVRVDPTQLQQVLVNLALNARDAMPSGGRLVISTKRARFDESDLARHFEVQPGHYVAISVADTGHGIDEETKAHLFEPFFTTKGVGKGTGLGLATTYGIVKQSGGHIWVYSEPGEGATFRVHLPALSEPSRPEPAERATPSPRSGRVLLVEDESILRELAEKVLTRRGFTVVAASSPLDALARLEELGDGRIALLVSDVVMPGMSGPDLALELRARWPDLPVLLMSGYAEDMAGVREVPDAGFVAKPFTPDRLLRSIDALVLRGTPPGT